MEELREISMLQGDEVTRLELYESYTLGKSNKMKFNKGVHNSKGF